MLLTESKEYASLSLILMQNIINRQILSKITSKGQVSLPIDIQRHLGVSTSDKVAFQITSQGDVLLTVPRYRTLAELKGSAGKLPHPLTEQEIKNIIADERAEAAMKNA